MGARKDEGMIVYGVHPVEEFLNKQAQRVTEVVIRQGSAKNLRAIIDRCTRYGIPVRFLKNQVFDKIAKGRPFQGVFIKTGPFVYADVDDIESEGFLVALDNITDPQNFGSLIRSAAFFGAKGIIITKDRSVAVTPTVIKASAGAAANMPIVRVTNLARTLMDLKERGFWIIGADAHDGDMLPKVDPPYPYILVLGSEGSGLRRLVKKTCDLLVQIPGKTESLNVAVAGAVLMYGLQVKGKNN